MAKEVQTTAKDFFLWLTAVAALYVSVISMVALLFEYIDRLFGDPLSYAYDPFSTGVRVAMASLIIIFPVYVWFTRILNSDLRKHPEKKELWVRRWLLVLTLFLAGATIVIDLIVLVNRFLGGEVITASFLLKVAAVLIVAGGTFLYYLNDLRGTWERKERQSVLIGGIVSALVLVTIVSGFFVIGSPQSQRELRFDQQKVRDLENIQYQIIDHWRSTETLPSSLEALEDPLTGFVVPQDPQEGMAYEYSVVSAAENTFELCATFNRPSPQQDVEMPTRPFGVMSEHWQHDAGRTCFERTIDPEQFPPFPEDRRSII